MGKHTNKKIVKKKNKNHIVQKQKDPINLRSKKSQKDVTFTDIEQSLSSSKKLSKKEKKKMSKFKKIILKIIFFIFLVSSIIFVFCQTIEAFKWIPIAKQMCKNSNSIVLDLNGDTVTTIGNERLHENVNSDKIPTNLKNAYISIEDERFYKHKGVDVKRTGAAIINYIVHLGHASFGGSTITQQLVKNITGNDDSSINRKFTEWLKSFELELSMKKDDILTSYLNIIYIGQDLYGVEMGSKFYFDKDVSELTLAECAFLAGINHSPNYYNPYSNEDKSEQIKKRTKIVLQKMKELSYISDEDFSSAISDVDSGLSFKKGKIPSDESLIYSYHTDALISDVISDISKKKNIDEKFATNYLYMGGLTIQSTQDTSIQEKLEQEFAKKQYIIPSQNIKDESSQAAMVIIDHGSRFCCWHSSVVLAKRQIIADLIEQQLEYVKQVQV